MNQVSIRRSGILLHPSSLPGTWGIGDLGEQAHKFLDFLAETHQQVWQILPLGPTGEDGSPYSSFSSSAGNPLLISIEALVEDGLCLPTDSPGTVDSSPVDQGVVRAAKLPVLKEAAAKFAAGSVRRAEFESFRAEQSDWLDDYALFMAIQESYPGKSWNHWPAGLARRDPGALESARRDWRELVDYHIFTQFAFFRQWSRVREAARRSGITIVGDIPFYVAFDSADVWANPEYFALDPATCEPRLMAGVPPDYFSLTGQLWGNPVYDWEHLRRRGFDWWVRRFRGLTRLVDVVRIDHFRGFAAYWQVPRGETTAINGKWAPCPGGDFFSRLQRELGHLPVWAEDLGVITPDVEKLRDDFGFPGMKVLQFAFDEKGANNPYLPFNFPRNCVCYTGTHDNDTTLGWWSALEPAQKQRVLDYLGGSGEDQIHASLIRLAMSSVADTVVFPLQDLLGLGPEGRMNVPGRAAGNWSWRSSARDLTEEVRSRLEGWTSIYGRARPAGDAT